MGLVREGVGDPSNADTEELAGAVAADAGGLFYDDVRRLFVELGGLDVPLGELVDDVDVLAGGFDVSACAASFVERAAWGVTFYLEHSCEQWLADAHGYFSELAERVDAAERGAGV